MRRTTVGRAALVGMVQAFILAIAAALAAPAAAQTGQNLLQQALVKEQAEGDLQSAIDLYERITSEFADDRALAARALYRMGECYEKMGRREAREAYRTLVERYPDQTDLAAQAEGRLRALDRDASAAHAVPAAEGLQARLVWDGTADAGVDAMGGPFSDGRRLVYVDWDTGDLAIRDLVTGASRQLTHDGAWDEGLQQYPVNAVVAPDGESVAYSWVVYRHESEEGHRYELRVADTDTGEHRTLYSGAVRDQMFPFAWSPDSRLILAARYSGSDAPRPLPMELGIIAADGGEFRELKRFPDGFWVSAGFSPDGEHVAVSYPVAADSGREDILLIPADSGPAIPLVTHPANDHFLGWIPGTRRVLFRSDRSGTWDAWVVTVGPDGAEGPPRPVRRRIGEIGALGFSGDGTLFYSTFTRWYDLALAPFEAATGKIDPDDGESLLGSDMQPVWEPHGRRLAFLQETKRPGNDHFRELHLWDEVTGEERVVVDELDAMYPRWSPDGASILVSGSRDPEESESFYRVDVETGRADKILEVPTEGRWWLGRADWAPEGDAIVYTLFDRLVRRDLRTGEERTLFQHPRLIGLNLARSPSGRWVALGIGSPTWSGNPHADLGEGGRIVILAASGGEPREIARITTPGRIRGNFAWAPDGEALYFLERDFDEELTRLWRAPVNGAGAELVWEGKQWLMDLSIHPQGNRVAVSAYTNETQIWALEGLKAAVRRPD